MSAMDTPAPISSAAQARLTLWSRAAQRALAADLPRRIVLRAEKPGYVLVPSRSQDGHCWYVQLLSGGRVGRCDCPSGLNGRPCSHRAAVALRLWERRMGGARITTVKPAGVAALAAALEPPAPAAAVAPVAVAQPVRMARRQVDLV